MMGQIYRHTATFSEGFFSFMSREQKSAFLKEKGLTFFYNSSCRKTAVFFDSSVNTDESRRIEKWDKEFLIPSSMEELEDAYNSCYDAVGLYEKDVSTYEKWLEYRKKQRERLGQFKD